MRKYKILVITGIFVFISLFIYSNSIYASENKTFDVIYIDRIFSYTGQEVDFSKSIWVVDENGCNLEKDVDYTVKCFDNINAGEGTLLVTGIGEYVGERTVKFNITKAELKNVDIEEIPEQEFTGTKICPELIMKYIYNYLEKNKDYTVTFTNNTACGIAEAEITGIGNYEGTISKTFRIINSGEKNEISSVSAYNIPQIYTGKLIELSIITVKNIYGDILLKDKDYTVEYLDNINVGEASFIVTGIGDYIGTIESKFQIIPYQLGSVNIENIPNQKYTGKEICPILKVSNGNMILTEGIDYKVEYFNNINPGTAKIRLTGLGNYTGRVIKEFNIKAANKDKQIIKAANVTKVYSKKSFNLKVTVKGDAKLKFISSNKKVVTINSKGRISIKGAGKSIINIVASETEKYNKAEKKIVVNILPKCPKYSISRKGSNSIKVKWEKCSGIGENKYLCKYYIKYSTNKDFKSSKSLSVKGKKDSREIKGLKTGKVYYVKMRTFSTELNKYSSWTKYKTIAI